MNMDNDEKILFTNTFGVVSSKRVIINSKNGTEDFPIRQISSISFHRKQNKSLALVYFLFGFLILAITVIQSRIPGIAIVVVLILFLLCILIGIAYYIGNYQIKFSIAGQDRTPIKVEMAKTKEGREFSDAVRQQIISN